MGHSFARLLVHPRGRTSLDEVGSETMHMENLVKSGQKDRSTQKWSPLSTTATSEGISSIACRGTSVRCKQFSATEIKILREKF